SSPSPGLRSPGESPIVKVPAGMSAWGMPCCAGASTGSASRRSVTAPNTARDGEEQPHEHSSAIVVLPCRDGSAAHLLGAYRSRCRDAAHVARSTWLTSSTHRVRSDAEPGTLALSAGT